MGLPKINKNVSAKAREFAEREYETDGYEREWLGKGYYHGYMDAIQAIKESINHQIDENNITEQEYKQIWLARDETGLLHAFHAKPIFDKQSGCWCRGDEPTEAQLRRRVGRSSDRIFVSLNDDEYPYIKYGECFEFKLVDKTETAEREER